MSTMQPSIRIAIVASSEKRRRRLKLEIERRSGIEIVACTALTDAFLHQLSSANADVLLVDMYDDDDEPDPDLFQKLLDTKGIPIVFNDSDSEDDVITQAWVDKLIAKLGSSLTHKLQKRNKLQANIGEVTKEEEKKKAELNQAKWPSHKSKNKNSTRPILRNKLAANYEDSFLSKTGDDAVAIDFEKESGIPTLSANHEVEQKTEDQKSGVKTRTGKEFVNFAETKKASTAKSKPVQENRRSAPLDRTPILKEKSQQEPKISTTKPAVSKSEKTSINVDYFIPTDSKVSAASIDGKLVWVLGASIGGPQAVKRFLAELPENTDVCFLLVQHIGINFVELLAEQLERSTAFRVICAKQGSALLPNQVVVAPADQYLSINASGTIRLKRRDKAKIYNPCIDDVLGEVVKTLASANTIIFSGMGDDGANGVEQIAAAGGFVWAQDADSCIVSSMPDCARQRGVVSFSGTPEQLAAQFMMELKKTANPKQHRGVS